MEEVCLSLTFLERECFFGVVVGTTEKRREGERGRGREFISLLLMFPCFFFFFFFFFYFFSFPPLSPTVCSHPLSTPLPGEHINLFSSLHPMERQRHHAGSMDVIHMLNEDYEGLS